MTPEQLDRLLGLGGYVQEDPDVALSYAMASNYEPSPTVTGAYANQKARWDDSVRANRENPVNRRARQAGTWGILSEPPNRYGPGSREEMALARYLQQRQDYQDRMDLLRERMMLGAETERYKADKLGGWREEAINTKREGIDAANQRAQMRTILPFILRAMVGQGGGAQSKLPNEIAGPLYMDVRKRLGGDRADPRAVIDQFRQITGGPPAPDMDQLLEKIRALQAIGIGGF